MDLNVCQLSTRVDFYTLYFSDLSLASLSANGFPEMVPAALKKGSKIK